MKKEKHKYLNITLTMIKECNDLLIIPGGMGILTSLTTSTTPDPPHDLQYSCTKITINLISIYSLKLLSILEVKP